MLHDSKPNIAPKRSVGAILCETSIIVVISIALGMAYFFPWSTLPKTESLDFSVLPMIDFWRKLWAGRFPIWNFNVAIGSPWPPPHGLETSPLSPLLPFMRPTRFIGLTVIFHSVVSLLCLRELLRRYRTTGWTRMLALLTFSWSTNVEYIYWLEAPEVYVGTTLLPAILLALVIVLGEDNGRTKYVAAFALGMTVAYGCVNAHPGTFVLYLMILIIFVVVQPKALIANFRFLFLGAAIAFAAAIGKIWFLINEISHMPTGVLRTQQGLSESWPGLFWTALLRPLFIPYMGNGKNLLSDYVLQNAHSTFFFIGLPFLAACIVAVARYWQTQAIRPIVIGFLFSILTLGFPVYLLPTAFSATYPARDAALLFGVILAGTMFSDAVRGRTKLSFGTIRAAQWMQFISVVFSAIPLFWGFNLVHNDRYPSVGELDRATGHLESAFAQSVAKNFPLDSSLQPRLASSSLITDLSQVEIFDKSGLFANVALSVGYADVGFIGKGVSYDGLRRTTLVPYGIVAGDRFQNYKAGRNPFYPENYERDWPIDDQSWLTLLDIEGVIALKSQKVSATSLHAVATLPGVTSAFDYIIYRNDRILPRAVWVDKTILDDSKLLRDNCTDGSFYCYDAASVVAAALPIQGKITFDNDRIRVNFLQAPRDLTRTHDLLITNYYRPEWTGSVGSVTSWHGLTRVSLPESTRDLILAYNVQLLVVLRILGFAMFAAAYIFAGVLLLRSAAINLWKRP